MDNIEIKRQANKRNIQSLLDESAIDDEFNYEAQQVRQAYNKTIRDLNQRIRDHEREITKLKLQNAQKDEIIQEQAEMLRAIENRLEQSEIENSELRKSRESLTKRLQQVEYRLETIQKNRNLVQEDETQFDEECKKVEEVRSNARKVVYREISQVLNLKIGKFVKQTKNYAMSPDLQRQIEAFLEDIVYINPNEARNKIFENNRASPEKNRTAGRISERRNLATEKLTDMEEWKRIEKSLSKLKGTSSYTHNSRKQARGRLEEGTRVVPVINYT